MSSCNINQKQNKFFRYLNKNNIRIYFVSDVRKKEYKIEATGYSYPGDGCLSTEVIENIDSLLSKKSIYKINGIYYKFSYSYEEWGCSGEWGWLIIKGYVL